MYVTYIVPFHELVPRLQLLGHWNAFELERVNSRLRSRHLARPRAELDASDAAASEQIWDIHCCASASDSLLATVSRAQDWCICRFTVTRTEIRCTLPSSVKNTRRLARKPTERKHWRWKSCHVVSTDIPEINGTPNEILAKEKSSQEFHNRQKKKNIYKYKWLQCKFYSKGINYEKHSSIRLSVIHLWLLKKR